MVDVIIVVHANNGAMLSRNVELQRVPVVGDHIQLTLESKPHTWLEYSMVEKVILSHSSKAVAIITTDCPVTKFKEVEWADPDVRVGG